MRVQTHKRRTVTEGIDVGMQCPSCEGNSTELFLEAPDRFHGRDYHYVLLRCSSCSVVWLHNAPSFAEIGDHYGPDYDRSVAAAGDAPERWTGRVETIKQHKAGGTLLDLGCSSGGFLRAMRDPSWQLYGIEMSSDVARHAEARSGAEVFVGDILDAPFLPDSFDVITCFHVFEHLYQPKEVLKKVDKWLKPGGIFCVMVPNINSAGAKIFGKYWYALELPRHLYHFSPESLTALVSAAGLRLVSLETGRELFVENSCRYIVDELFRRLAIPREPLSKAHTPNLGFRIARKAFRVTVLPVLNGLASLIGGGESMCGVFAKAAHK